MPSEAVEQRALFEWAAFASASMPELELLYHIPNGGYRNKAEAANLKRQGVKAGVPDLCLPVARKGFNGLYIELKAGKNKASNNQEKWINSLTAEGYLAVICHGWNEAAQLLKNYLQGA